MRTFRLAILGLLTALALVAAATTFTRPAQAQLPPPEVTASSEVIAEPGQGGTVLIALDTNGVDVGALSVSISYDPDVVAIDQSDCRVLVANGNCGPPEPDGELLISAFSTQVSIPSDIAELDFVGVAPGTSAIDVTITTIGTIEGERITNAIATDATIQVLEGDEPPGPDPLGEWLRFLEFLRLLFFLLFGFGDPIGAPLL